MALGTTLADLVQLRSDTRTIFFCSQAIWGLRNNRDGLRCGDAA